MAIGISRDGREPRPLGVCSTWQNAKGAPNNPFAMIRTTVIHYRRLTTLNLYDWERKTSRQARIDLIERRTVWLFWVLPLLVCENIVRDI